MRGIALAALLMLAAPALAQTYGAPAIGDALAAPDRSSDARFRDRSRQPDLIFAAAEIKPGDRVLDVGAGGGYLTLLASSLAGETGRVDLHNTPGWIAQFPYLDPEDLAGRIRRGNVGYIVSAWDELPGESGTYDVILMGQVYHDTLLEAANVPVMNARLFDLLKPGGRLIVEDHDGDPDMPPARQVGLHRLAKGVVIGELTAAGFENTGEAYIAPGKDDYRFNVFRPNLRGRTNRYILTFTKPATRLRPARPG